MLLNPKCELYCVGCSYEPYHIHLLYSERAHSWPSIFHTKFSFISIIDQQFVESRIKLRRRDFENMIASRSDLQLD